MDSPSSKVSVCEYLQKCNSYVFGLRSLFRSDPDAKTRIKLSTAKVTMRTLLEAGAWFANHLSFLPKEQLDIFFETLAEALRRCEDDLLYTLVMENENEIGEALRLLLASMDFAFHAIHIVAYIHHNRCNDSWNDDFMEEYQLLEFVQMIARCPGGEFWNQKTVDAARALFPLNGQVIPSAAA